MESELIARLFERRCYCFGGSSRLSSGGLTSSCVEFVFFFCTWRPLKAARQIQRPWLFSRGVDRGSWVDRGHIDSCMNKANGGPF